MLKTVSCVLATIFLIFHSASMGSGYDLTDHLSISGVLAGDDVDGWIVGVRVTAEF